MWAVGGSSRHHRLDRHHWVPRFHPGERAPLLEPAPRGRVPPQCLTLRVIELPAYRLEVRIAGQVITREQLDAVAVGIAQVKEEGVGDTVAARATLDRAAPPGGGEHVAGADDVELAAHPEADVMQARPHAVCE